MSSTDETLEVLGDIKEMLAYQISVGESTNRLLSELSTSIDTILGVSTLRGATSLRDIVYAVQEVRDGLTSVELSIETLGS